MVPVQLFPASIKNYLVATMACLCIPGVGALTYMAGQSLGDVRTNMRLTDLVEADRALLLAGNLIRSNRGQAQTAIQAAEDPKPIIQKAEQGSRAELANAVARLKATDLPDREALIDAIIRQEKATDAKLADLHAEAAKPKAQRSLGPTMPWYNSVGDIETAPGQSVRLDLERRQAGRPCPGRICRASRPRVGASVPTMAASARSFVRRSVPARRSSPRSGGRWANCAEPRTGAWPSCSS